MIVLIARKSCSYLRHITRRSNGDSIRSTPRGCNSVCTASWHRPGSV
jgi:hypothetical protein